MKERLLQIVKWIRSFIRDKFNSKNEELPYYIAIVLAVILFGVSLNAFIELTEGLAEDTLAPYDDAISEFIVGYRSEPLTSILRFFTEFGDRYVYIIITLMLGFFFWFKLKNRKFTIQVVLVLVLASLTNIMLKRVINRERPSAEHLVEVNTLSFPSGHSMSAMAFYGFLIYLCLRYKMKKRWRITLITVLLVIIFGVGLSRIYLGVHYPSDVGAGYVGGLIWVALSIVVFNLFELLRNRRKGKDSLSSV